MFDEVRRRFIEEVPRGATSCALRVIDERSEVIESRRGVTQPLRTTRDTGAMITVHAQGGAGWAATADLSRAGLREAARRALGWAEATAARSVVDTRQVPLPASVGSYRTPAERPASSAPLGDRVAWVQALGRGLRPDERIIDWRASLWSVDVDSLYATADGGHVEQRLNHLAPDLSVTAHHQGETITRSTGARGKCFQGGLERLERLGLPALGARLADEALQLTTAPDCPGGERDVVLMPDQMLLQIHESIGHPIELDRILGDERNYAGTSFVTVDMFGRYQYGSELLNVTFDPALPTEFASYAFDDEGAPAERVFLIERGVLVRPLGGALSAARAGLPGVANARASSWNRPPIDRMANLNLEPGDCTLEALIGKVERGVLMETNCSWSIDDSRNKFQFGCELGRVIEDGRLGGLVKKPNYRGTSARFWRNLAAVGDASTMEALGSPYCGKGEPNQMIRVGHAAPACLFTGVEVFGGHA